jgi:hypothetical protein
MSIEKVIGMELRNEMKRLRETGSGKWKREKQKLEFARDDISSFEPSLPSFSGEKFSKGGLSSSSSSSRDVQYCPVPIRSS